jgi:tetratricopeptide (TPR) repeat protein
LLLAVAMFEHSSGHIDEPLRDLVNAFRFREALSLFLEWCEQSVELTPVSQLLAAHAASRIGEFELAGTLATTAEPEFRASGDSDGVLDCANLLGAVAFERGHIEDAEAHFRSVLQMAEAADCARFTARSANNLAVIAHLRGQREHACALYQKALEAYHQIDDERGIIETRHNLAFSYREAGRTEEALLACTRAVDAAERLGAGGLIALTLLGRAELLIECDALDRATADIDRAQLLAWLEGNGPHVLESERLRALLALRRGQPAHAHLCAVEVRTRASHSGCALIAAESAAIAALALKAERRLPEAAAANDLAVASLVALGASGRLENHARAWRDTAA